MLAQVPRIATSAAFKGAFPSPTSCRSQAYGWLTCLTYPSQLLQQSAASRAQASASDGFWQNSLKQQIIKSAESPRFRYEVDNHKWHDDGTLDQAEKAIGYRFQNRQILRLALTHSSTSAECNIPLAWIGDAVLQLVVVEGLLSRYTAAASIGDMSKLRSAMIGRASCSTYAKQMRLQQFLIVGKAIDGEYPQEKFPSNMMAELFEAVLGAVYVDADMTKAHSWFDAHLKWPRSYQAAVDRFHPQA